MDTFLRCAACGERIGVYEPLWWELPDGSIVDSALLALRKDARSGHAHSRFYHHGCLAPAEVPGES
jgi:hypothetical protein